VRGEGKANGRWPCFFLKKYLSTIEKNHTFNGYLPTNFYPFLMEINEHLISRLERLARLPLDPTERSRLQSDLGNILQMVDKLSELDTTGVEPLIWINENEDALREDIPGNTVSQAAALSNAPRRDGPYFQVPKVIE
jgi:aspartyl-tRNA(Asn)/glutamyl-tRNA(Gln) amidotransferase subunit C